MRTKIFLLSGLAALIVGVHDDEDLLQHDDANDEGGQTAQQKNFRAHKITFLSQVQWWCGAWLAAGVKRPVASTVTTAVPHRHPR